MSGYDSDVSTYDPQGRVQQLQYALEAHKLGAPVVGICSDNIALLIAVRKQPSKLAAYQPKLFKIAKHVGCAAAGIYSDVKKILQHSRHEAQAYEYETNEDIPLKKIILSLVEDAQQRTQFSGLRPYGAAVIFAGHEDNKPVIFVTDASANIYQYKAFAVGRAAQAINAYLVQHYEECMQSTKAANDDKDREIELLTNLALKAFRQANVKATDPSAVEIGVVDIKESKYFLVPGDRSRAIATKFNEENPIVEEDTDESK